MLTQLQHDALAVIQELVDFEGRPPTIETLREELGLGTRSQVHQLLVRLKERGFIDWTPGAARSVRLLRRIPMPDFARPELEVTLAGERTLRAAGVADVASAESAFASALAMSLQALPVSPEPDGPSTSAG